MNRESEAGVTILSVITDISVFLALMWLSLQISDNVPYNEIAQAVPMIIGLGFLLHTVKDLIDWFS